MQDNVEISWGSTKRALENLKTNLTIKRGARDHLVKINDEEKDKLIEFKQEQQLFFKTQQFLLEEVKGRRKQAMESIENMGTCALRLVYGQGYRLKFNTFDEDKKDGVSKFKMELNIVSPFEDGELTTDLMGARGGGVVEIVAFAIRIAALNWAHYTGPLILDEAYKSMSNDGKLKSVANFLYEVSKSTNRQIIFATHKSDVFGEIADNIILVENNNGIAKCTYIDDIADLPTNNDENDEENDEENTII
jgi:hypothetical protein